MTRLEPGSSEISAGLILAARWMMYRRVNGTAISIAAGAKIRCNSVRILRSICLLGTKIFYDLLQKPDNYRRVHTYWAVERDASERVVSCPVCQCIMQSHLLMLQAAISHASHSTDVHRKFLIKQ